MTSATGEGTLDARGADPLARRYERILDSLAEGVLVLDRTGRITFVNPAAAHMLGYARDEMLAYDGPAHDLLHHSHKDGTPYPREGCPTYATVHEGVVARARAGDGEVLWRKDGSPLPVAYASAPIVEDGEITGATLVFMDATGRLRRQDERAALHREAAESEKLAALGTLVSGLSHEIKTPLTILQNNAFLARFQMEGAARESPAVAAAWARVRERFDEMEEAVDRMTRLVGELRRFSRLDGTLATPTALEDVVVDAARLFKLAYRSSVQVELDLRETRPVLVDPFKVQQLLMNLLENAADATVDQGGRVRVRTRMAREGDRALLVVEDDGLGIPEAVQARMYDPLFTTKDEGAGLGLAIVRRIADEHDAQVRCDSAPGKGAVFTVSFPLATYG